MHAPSSPGKVRSQTLKYESERLLKGRITQTHSQQHVTLLAPRERTACCSRSPKSCSWKTHLHSAAPSPTALGQEIPVTPLARPSETQTLSDSQCKGHQCILNKTKEKNLTDPHESKSHILRLCGDGPWTLVELQRP